MDCKDDACAFAAGRRKGKASRGCQCFDGATPEERRYARSLLYERDALRDALAGLLAALGDVVDVGHGYGLTAAEDRAREALKKAGGGT